MSDRNLAMLITLLLFLFIVLVFMVKDVAAVLILVFVSVSVLKALNELVERFLKNRTLSIFISLSLYFLFLAFTLWLIIPAVVKEFGSFYNLIMGEVNLKGWKKFFENEKMLDLFQKSIEYIKPKVSDYVNGVLAALATSTPNFVMQLFFVILGTIYSLVYFKHVRDLPKVLYPKRVYPIVLPFSNELFANLMRFVQAVFVTALLTGFLFFTAFQVMNLKYSVTIGVWAFVTNFMPIVGVLFEYIPVLLFSLSLGFKGVVIMTLITLAIHAISFITFIHMMKGYSNISPVEMLFFILLLWKVYGLMGIFIAVPLTIFINTFWKYFIKPHFEEE